GRGAPRARVTLASTRRGYVRRWPTWTGARRRARPRGADGRVHPPTQRRWGRRTALSPPRAPRRRGRASTRAYPRGARRSPRWATSETRREVAAAPAKDVRPRG